MEQRICTRCLLRDMLADSDDLKAKLEMLEKYREAIKVNDRVAQDEYERRLSVCRNCEKLVEGTCMACGCYVELRAVAKVSRCPKKKW